MANYFIANIKINSTEEYNKYLESCDEIFSKYDGEYLAVDRQPTILEGSWQYDRVVLIRFNSEEDLRKWYGSPDYQEILKYRLAGARCDTIIAKGL